MNPSSKTVFLSGLILLSACGKQMNSTLTSSRTREMPTQSRSLEEASAPQEQEGKTDQVIPAAGKEAETVTTIIDSCFSPDEPCDKKIIQFINSARHSLEIAVFSFTHPGIATAIAEAQKRGVKVRMVVDRDQAEQKTSQIDELQEAGIPLKFGHHQGSMHNKFTIVDRAALQTGSYNYTRAATSYNAENQLYLKDPQVISRYQKDFEKLWKNGLKE